MPPDLAWGRLLGRQEGRERALQYVGVPADGVRSVAVVGTLAVETQVVGRRDEERLQQLSVGQRVQLRRHVEDATCDGHRAPEPQQPAAHNVISASPLTHRQDTPDRRNTRLTP